MRCSRNWIVFALEIGDYTAYRKLVSFDMRFLREFVVLRICWDFFFLRLGADGMGFQRNAFYFRLAIGTFNNVKALFGGMEYTVDSIYAIEAVGDRSSSSTRKAIWRRIKVYKNDR